jgi:N-acetylmuramoyl-L-alanine amidase
MRRQGIRPECVLGHSDVAPARKADPGEKFDWTRLARRGIGICVAAAPLEEDEGFGLGHAGAEVARLRAGLRKIGFGIEPDDDFDLLTGQTLTAFQRHWRPEAVDGRADRSTLRTLAKVQRAFEAARAVT